MDKKQNIVICRPVIEGEVVGPGIELDTCPRCKTGIWVNPNSRRCQTEHGAKLLCAACAFDLNESIRPLES